MIRKQINHHRAKAKLNKIMDNLHRHPLHLLKQIRILAILNKQLIKNLKRLEITF